MKENKEDLEELSRMAPEKLMTMFSETPLSKGVTWAIVLHIVFITLTSTGYLWRKFVTQEEPKTEAASEAETEADAEEAGATNAAAAAQAETTATAAEDEDPSERTRKEMGIPEQYKDSEVVKEITATAKPDEIPDAPPDDGLSIEDTDPF